MKKLKHNKLKNTGLIFEILTYQLTKELMNDSNKISYDIIKKHFTPESLLRKELTLYQSLFDSKFNSPTEIFEMINICKDVHKKLNKKQLFSERHALVKDIMEKYDINQFFNIKLKNYKVLASAYNLYEYSSLLTPSDSLKCKKTIVENLSNVNPNKNSFSDDALVYLQEDADTRLLAYNYMIKKFNLKYKHLNENQKRVLSNYIYSMADSVELTKKLHLECNLIVKTIKQYSGNKLINENFSIKAKLFKIAELVNKLKVEKVLDDKDVTNIINLYEMLESLGELCKDDVVEEENTTANVPPVTTPNAFQADKTKDGADEVEQFGYKKVKKINVKDIK